MSVSNSSTAYPKEAGVAKWARTIGLDRVKNAVSITDRYTLHKPGRIEMSLMTPSIVKQDGPRRLLFGRVGLTVTGPGIPAFRIEEIPMTDARLKSSWGDRLCRVVVTWDQVPATGELTMSLSAG